MSVAAIPSPQKSLMECLFNFSETTPSSDAIVTKAYTLSYRQLSECVIAQAKALTIEGVTEHSVVGIKCANDVEHLIVCLGLTYIGASSFTIPSYETTEVQDAIADQCGSSYVVTSSIDIASHCLHDLLESNTETNYAPKACLLFSTSGTTGKPKVVMHQDSDLVAQAHRHITNNQERFVCLAAIEHNFAKRHRLYCVAMGAVNVFIDADHQSLIDQCQLQNVNVMHVSAFQAQQLLGTAGVSQLSDIRLKLGGSHVPLQLRQQLKDGITANLQAGYGTTETGAIAFTDPSDVNAGESVGQALPGIEICAVTPDRKTLAQGQLGELAIRCDGMFRAYLNQEELTASRLEDSWFYTGDIGYLDAQGRIHLCGRADDMFVFNSINIYPQDIEAQLCQHPSIIDAAVLPKASKVHGNIPVALVVYAKGCEPDLSQLKKTIDKQLGIRSPRQFIVVEEIPRNSSGKILRHEAKNVSAKSELIRSTLLEALGNNLKKTVKPALLAAFEQGEKDVSLNELALDSLASMELLITIELQFNTVISPDELGKYNALSDIVAHVISSLSQEQPASVVNESPPIIESTAGIKPNIIGVFQRAFSFCKNITELNKLLISFESRLTPTQIDCLNRYHLNAQLIPVTVDEKFHVAMTAWLRNIKQLMLSSGKDQPEHFRAHKISPYVTHFVGSGSPENKTLIVCFAIRAFRHLSIPNAVLMQHTNAARYDLLIISEPLNKSFRAGVPFLGKNVIQIGNYLKNLQLIKQYQHTRTLGVSAGSYPAIISGYYLNAELVVSTGGRFKRIWRHPFRTLMRLWNTRQASRNRQCYRVLMTYSINVKLDRQYADIIASVFGGSSVGIQLTDKELGHTFLGDLLKNGGLASYLNNTIFSEIDKHELTKEKCINATLHIPEGRIVKNDY